MASNPKAKQIYVRWTQDDKHGGLMIALGTLEYLGISNADLEVGEITYQVGSAQIERQLYPGGPVVTYTRPQQTIKRVMGGSVSTSKAGHPMILEGSSGGRDTIRVTGSKRAFAKWLKSKVNMNALGETVVLKNWNRTTYAVLHEAVAL